MPTVIEVVPAKDRRHLHYGMKGNDVKAYGRLVARSLTHLGLKAVNAQNGVYGDGLLIDTLLLQRHEKIKADGTVGLATWQAVDPQMHAYERFLLKLPTPPPASNGMKIAAQMEAMLVLGMRYYSQARPAATTLAGFHDHDDCSGSALLARALATGATFDGYGYTGTIWDNFVHVDSANVQLGDFILYGQGGRTTHTAVVTDVRNQLAIGFGSAPGSKLPWRYRHDLLGFRRGA